MDARKTGHANIVLSSQKSNEIAKSRVHGIYLKVK